MRNLHDLDKYRVTHPARLERFGWAGDGTCGLFEIRSQRSGNILRVIASSTDNWDHVSVSMEKRLPNWFEMEQIKRMFFKDDETAMQLHVPPTDHINYHPNVLHIWRPHDREIPRPPGWMVGPQTNQKERRDGKTKGIDEPTANAGENGRAENPPGAA